MYKELLEQLASKLKEPTVGHTNISVKFYQSDNKREVVFDSPSIIVKESSNDNYTEVDELYKRVYFGLFIFLYEANLKK